MEATIKTTIEYNDNDTKYIVDIYLNLKYNDIFSAFIYIRKANQSPLSNWIKLYNDEPIKIVLEYYDISHPCCIQSNGINVKFLRKDNSNMDDEVITFTIKLNDIKPVIKKYIDYIILIQSGSIIKSNYNPRLL